MLRPLYDQVLIKKNPVEGVTKGGIIIPEQARPKATEGKVVALGKDVNLDIEVGDEVLFTKRAGTDINIGRENYLIVYQDEILGVCE